MKNFDKKLFGFLIGFAFPFILSLLFGIFWFYIDGNESRVLIYLSFGIFLGLGIDLKFLKSWVNKIYELAVWFIILIYFIYNIGIYGFFMGFPVFNVLLGLVAGYYFGKRICYKNIKSEIHKKVINQVSLFTGLIMTFICIASALIALTDKGIGENVQGMLGLEFEVTQVMILTIIFVGGFVLIVAQYFITKLTMQKIIGLSNKAC